MIDQNRPKLSLEEELDVLEAVYKIGEEKGLKLLRPEQVKKLQDAGRISLKIEKNQNDKKNKLSFKEALKISFDTTMSTFSVIDPLVPFVKAGKKIVDFPKSQWINIRSEVFEKYFGVSFDEFGKRIYWALVN